MIWMCVLFIKMDFVEMRMQIGSEQIGIESGMYDLSFSREDIESVEIVENLPEEKLVRTNGAAMEEYLPGKFPGKETGECRLYIYRGYTPILKIVVPEYTIYINSKTENQLEQWYQALK